MLQRRPLPPKKNTNVPVLKACLQKNEFEDKILSKNNFLRNDWNDIEIRKQAQLELKNCLKPSGPDPFPFRDALKLPRNYKILRNGVDYSYEFPFDSQVFNLAPNEASDDFNFHVVEQKQSKLNILNLNEIGIELPEISSQKPWRQIILEQFEQSILKYSDENEMLASSCNLSYKSCTPHVNSEVEEELISSLTDLLEKLSEEEQDLPFEELCQRYPEESRNILNQCIHLPISNEDAELKEDISQFALHEGLSADRTSLNLKGYFVDRLPSMKQKAMNMLKHANLSFNDFKSIPEKLMQAKSLLSLNMRNNPITKLSNNMQLFNMLTDLNMSFCCLTTLDKSLFSLVSLQVLDVSYNLLMSMESEIGYLRNLKELNVDGNSITSFPPTILELQLNILHCNLNFTNKVFWKFTAPKYVLKLSDICKQSLISYNISHVEVDTVASSSSSICHMCSMKKMHDGINVIKPISNVFGVKNLPILFSVCSQVCRKNLLDATKIPHVSSNNSRV